MTQIAQAVHHHHHLPIYHYRAVTFTELAMLLVHLAKRFGPAQQKGRTFIFGRYGNTQVTLVIQK